MRIPIHVYFILFVLSGFSGLIYESIWSHYLKLFLGHAAYAQTLVLAMFMGGLAIGSALSARFSHRWKNLLLGYALVEGIIGLFALLFHQVFVGTTELAFDTLIPMFSDSPFMVLTTKWGLASLIILPQSILLGMTFPFMVAGVLRKYPDAGGRAISTLYFTNSFGGVFGVLVSSFVLIQHMGLPGTIMVAGLINIALALVVWLLSAGDDLPLAETRPARTDTSLNIKSVNVPMLLLAVSLLTGLSSFMYEIGWIRMLSLVLGSSTHSFELMLAAFILGLALGGWWLRKRIDLIESPIRFLGYVQILMGICAIASLLIFHYSFDAMHALLDTIQRKESTYPVFLIFSGLICFAMMLPATFCAGMTLPLITKLAIHSKAGERGIGYIYASNTLGAITGIFLSVHLVMPLLGLKLLITYGAIIDIALGLFLLSIFLKQSQARAGFLMPATAVTVIAVLATAFVFEYDKERLSSGVYRKGAFLQDTENLFYKDGKTSTVSVFRRGDMITLANNGKPDATIFAGPNVHTGDETTQTLIGILPLLHTSNPQKAAVIGMGSGLSTHALLASSQLEQVDTIEIEAAVIEAANLFRPKSERAYSDKRSIIHIDDAKTFFNTHGHNYDIIVSEPPNPWVSGVASLFTREFYQRIKNHMAPDAVFVQWLQLYEINIELVATVFNALSSEFSDYVVYSSNNGTDMIIIAVEDGTVPGATIPLDQDNVITTTLASHGINSYNDLNLRLVSSKKIIGPAFSAISELVNSDYFPHLDNGAARARYALSRSDELFDMLTYQVPIIRTLVNDMDIRSDAYTYTSAYKLSANMYSANMVYRSLLDEQVEDRNIDGRKKLRSDFMTLLKSQLANCPEEELNQAIGMLHQLAGYTLPYLSRDELASVWNTVETSACIADTRENSALKQWVALYQAISDRDFQRIQPLSENILAENRVNDSKLAEFLVITALLGSYYSDSDSTTEILQRWGDKLAAGSPETRFAAAILASRTGNAAASTETIAESH
jgi:spermidine synthase